jgi:mono/diheme cytochrome c family protein
VEEVSDGADRAGLAREAALSVTWRQGYSTSRVPQAACFGGTGSELVLRLILSMNKLPAPGGQRPLCSVFVIAASLAVATVASFGAEGPAGEKSASPATPAAELWQRHCAKCHGADGKGNTSLGRRLGVKDYTSARVQAKFSDKQMAEATISGIYDHEGQARMRPYRGEFTPEEVAALVAYIRKFKR